MYVGLQFMLLAAIVLAPGKALSNNLELVGIAIMYVGVVISLISILQLRNYSLTALPTPVKHAKLLVTGLYKYARHPIYSGLIMFMSGAVISRYSALRLVLLLCLIALLFYKSTFEEQQLTATFGKSYKNYQSKTGRFFPGL